MAVRAYYNEVDAYAAEWIRNLIAAGLITAGDVDTRSVVDVHPSDLRGYARCHFFAGIGVWDYALGLAGWPADRPVWTGSCPCQPFSTAGRRGGTADERHLWPAWCHLIAECRPSTVLGEQVASADGLAWLDLVHADLDGLGYTFGAADLCAAGIGAPHIRQRSWFVAYASRERRERQSAQLRRPGSGGWLTSEGVEAARSGEARALANATGQRWDGPELAGAPGATAVEGAEEIGWWTAGVLEPAGCGAALGLAQPAGAGSQRRIAAGERPHAQRATAERGRSAGLVGDAESLGREGRQALSGSIAGRVDAGAGPACELADAHGGNARAEGLQRSGEHGQQPEDGSAVPHRWPGARHGGWDDADWILCRDGRWRPVEPGSFPLVDGAAFRVGSGGPFEGQSRIGMLKGYGNAIHADAAATFIAACLDVLPSQPSATAE